MASQEESDNVIGCGSNVSGEAPLWTYVTKVEKQGMTGGTWTFKRNICNETKKAIIQE